MEAAESEQVFESWAKHDKDPSKGLDTLLGFASTQHITFIDLFLRQRDSGLRTLAAALTAEFTLTGFYFSSNLSAVVAITALLLVASLAIPFTKLALINCKNAYSAGLEYALFSTKVVWAMGLAEDVMVPDWASAPPSRNDPSLYPPRYLSDARLVHTTEEFVRVNLEKSTTIFYSAKRLLWIMGLSATAVGLGSAAAIAFLR